MALTLAYALGRRGIPIIQVATSIDTSKATSRFVREHVEVGNVAASPEPLYAALDALAVRWPGAVVLPLADTVLHALSLAHARFAGRLRINCPPTPAVTPILDKEQTHQLAARLGLPIPRTFDVPDLATLERLAPSLPFPLFGKIRDKVSSALLRGPADFGLAYYPDLASFRAAFAANPHHGALYLFQEYCPGQDVLLSLILHRGQVLTAFQGRSLRTLPSTGGVSVLVRSEPVDPVLCEQVAQLLRTVGWEGIAEADLRHDPVTGRIVLLEINGRFWGSLAAALNAGVDFPHYVYQLALGQKPFPPVRYQMGVVTHWALGDCKRLVRLWRAPAPGESRFREVLRLLAAFRPGVRSMIWRWDDPGPAWAEWRGDLKWFVLAVAQRVRHRLGRFWRSA